MDVAKLKKEIKETIFPNGEKKIKGQKHQDMLFGLVDEIDRSDGLMRADIALNQETAMENRDNINDLRDETTEKFSKVDANISDINIRETETTREIDSIKNALRDVTSGKDNGQVTGGKVINIPTQATNSVAGYAIEGLTASNLVVNGDFSDGLKNWIGSTQFIIDNSIQIGDVKHIVYVVQPLSVVEGDLYFLQAKYKLEAVDSVVPYVGLILDKSYTGNYESINVNFINGDNTSSGIVRITESGLRHFGVYKQLGSTNKGWFNSLIVQELYAINLTAKFGAGNEPTKEWCDAHFPEYFDGEKSVKTPLRLSCGESKMFINSELELKTGDVIKDGVLNGKKLNTSGTLVTKADSKVVVDYAKNATLLYSKGLKIDDIKKLEVLQKFEEDGSITSLDIVKATYTDKVLTHPELKDLDVCYVEYIYDTGIYGNNTITYGIDKFITNAPLISPDGRKWRKVEVATNDGILTTKLEEVK